MSFSLKLFAKPVFLVMCGHENLCYLLSLESVSDLTGISLNVLSQEREKFHFTWSLQVIHELGTPSMISLQLCLFLILSQIPQLHQRCKHRVLSCLFWACVCFVLPLTPVYVEAMWALISSSVFFPCLLFLGLLVLSTTFTVCCLLPHVGIDSIYL